MTGKIRNFAVLQQPKKRVNPQRMQFLNLFPELKKEEIIKVIGLQEFCFSNSKWDEILHLYSTQKTTKMFRIVILCIFTMRKNDSAYWFFFCIIVK